jgi:hypothetical protein
MIMKWAVPLLQQDPPTLLSHDKFKIQSDYKDYFLIVLLWIREFLLQ